MSQHLSVGLRSKGMTLTDELIPQLLEILDYPVMDERQFPALIEMRMGIFIGYLPMCRPSGVSNAGGTIGRFPLNQLRQARDTARALAELHHTVFHRRDARGVVPAIFQSAQTVQQDGSRFCIADISDYPAHK